MRAGDVLRTALQSFMGNLARASLTVLGLGIGVGACIAIGSLGTAAVRSVRAEMDRFGVDRIWITDAPGNAALLDEKDLDALRSTGRTAAALSRSAAPAQADARKKTCEVLAVTEDYAEVENLTLSSGRFFLPQDGQNLLRTAVIEDILEEELYGSGSAVGQRLRVGDHTFTVVGVIKTVRSAYFAVDSAAPKVYLPLKTHQQLTGGVHYDEIVLRTGGQDVSAAAASARTALESAHGGRDSFLITSLDEQIASADRVLSIVTTVLVVVGLICMLTGGVGVMNVMLTGVRERRREIGVRKALGAKDAEIFVQFVCEAALYGACGAVLGMLIGALLTHLGQSVIGVEAQPVLWVTVCAVTFSCCVGAVSGVYPSMRASRIPPVEAMRQM